MGGRAEADAVGVTALALVLVEALALVEPQLTVPFPVVVASRLPDLRQELVTS